MRRSSVRRYRLTLALSRKYMPGRQAICAGPSESVSTLCDLPFVLRLRYSQPEVSTKGLRMNRTRLAIVLIMLTVLAVTLAGAFLTRGVMAYLPFLQAR